LAAILITAALGLTTTACTGVFAKVAVKAIARGAPAAAPFFNDALRLAMDVPVSEALALGGGTKKGDEPGLYGGLRKKQSCSKNTLVEFLKHPANRQKAAEWTKIQGLGDADKIEGFIKNLTPVLLRNDTLVKNHDYKKGKAVPFDALLEAGIAVLVDLNGKPVVQCSCGNPLGTFEHDADGIKVEFKDKNKKWKSYDLRKIVKVEPTDTNDEVKSYELVDVDKKDAGIARLPGTDGLRDESLPADPNSYDDPSSTSDQADVPAVTGLPAQEATKILEDQGFQVHTSDGPSGSADPDTVLGQAPAAGEQVPQGAAVTLTVAPSVTPPGTEPPSPTPSPTDTAEAIRVTALAEAPVRESPSVTSLLISYVAAGGQYPAACYDYGETINTRGSTSDIWARLSLKSGDFGWVTATALQEDPAAGGLSQC
jgi:hypothetical protein